MIFNIFGFYKFKKINNLKKIKLKLQDSLLKHNFRGSIIISQEGINGTISGKSNILKI